MTQESGVPRELIQKLRNMWLQDIAAEGRSAPLRNATISGGGLTIKGGFLRLMNALQTVTQFFIGAMAPNLPDGSPQQGMVLRREDGTLAMALYDPDPSVDFKQFLAIFDRAQNIILSDDTDAGQGLSRPYLVFPFYSARFIDTPSVSTSATFETLWQGATYKHHAGMFVGAASVTDAGTAGEVRVLVNGAPLGSTQAVSTTAASNSFGTAAVAGLHMSALSVQIQARVTSGAGAVRVIPQAGVGLPIP